VRVHLRHEIKELQRKLGVTSLYVTHDQVEAMTLADRMIVMNEGLAEQIGAPLDVYADPQTAFVAGFIGSPPTNFLDPERLGRNAPDGALVGVRPEHILLSSDGGRLTGTVLNAEPLGAESLIHVEVNGQTVTVRQDGAQRIPAEGENVQLDWDDVQELLFGPDGRRARA